MNWITVSSVELRFLYAEVLPEDADAFANFIFGEGWERKRIMQLDFKYWTIDQVEKIYKKWVKAGRYTFDEHCKKYGINPNDVGD